MRMRNLSFIWFVGAVVWWIDAAVAVHYGNKPHAILALAVACVFFAAGIMWVKSTEKRLKHQSRVRKALIRQVGVVSEAD
jgi:membrane protein implicated in regulation of membrane protease activity